MPPWLMEFFCLGALPYYRMNYELEMLTIEHNQVMSGIQKLPMEISDTLDKCNRQTEETESFR